MVLLVIRWGFFIISLLVMQTYLDVLFNSWYKDFYDILQTAKNGISDFKSIKGFCIALPYVTLFAFTNWFTRLWAFRWREAMTFSYVPYWRATEARVEGSSQRIQEDCMNFAKIVESIGLQVVQAISINSIYSNFMDTFFKCYCPFFKQRFRIISVGSAYPYLGEYLLVG